MSLGAIDFGLIVDSSVIMVENCVRRLAHEGGTRPKLDIVRDAAIEVRKPTMFGELIIAIVYLPILALQGTEGKLFRPMALTVIFALAGSLVLSLTLHAGAGLARPLPTGPQEKEVWLIRWIKRLYTPVLDLFVRHPVIAVVLAAGSGRRQRADRLEHGGRVHAPAQRGRPPDRGRAHPLGLARGGGADVDPDRERSSRRSPRCGWSTARPAGPRSPTT